MTDEDEIKIIEPEEDLESEEDLEQEVEEIPEEFMPSFEAHDRAAPILESSGEFQDIPDIESIAQEGKTKPESDDLDYNPNSPDYAGSGTYENIQEGPRRTDVEMDITGARTHLQPTLNHQPEFNLSTFQQQTGARQERDPEDYQAKMEKKKDNKLPFQ